MSTKLSRFAVPVAFFFLAWLAWAGLGQVAVLDVGASISNDLQPLFSKPVLPTHQVLGWTLFCVVVVSFICGLVFTWRLFGSFGRAGRA
jgi:hypothetical protein